MLLVAFCSEAHHIRHKLLLLLPVSSLNLLAVDTASVLLLHLHCMVSNAAGAGLMTS
jgi:hypothetical protein